MADSFSEVTQTGWLSRIGSAIKGILVGGVLVLLAFVVLGWNEHRAVVTANSLEEGQKNVVTISADKVDPANDGKLVHLTAPGKTPEKLVDSEFGVSADALVLRRTVSMYQWIEEKKETTEKKLGGGETKTTTYTYKKDWRDVPVDSSKFNEKERLNHINPPMPFQGTNLTAKPITVGAFALSPTLAQKISPDATLPLSQATLATFPSPLKDSAKLDGQNVYVGANPAMPDLGDLRISYKLAEANAPLSLMAQQYGSTFQPYQTKAGDRLEILRQGSFSSGDLIAKAQAENTQMTWILRLVGFVMFFIGFSMIFKPLSVVADVLPFLGSLVGMGTGLLAFLLALCLSALTIALTWVAVRPMVGIPLLLVSLAAGYGIIHMRKKQPAVAMG